MNSRIISATIIVALLTILAIFVQTKLGLISGRENIAVLLVKIVYLAFLLPGLTVYFLLHIPVDAPTFFFSSAFLSPVSVITNIVLIMLMMYGIQQMRQIESTAYVAPAKFLPRLILLALSLAYLWWFCVSVGGSFSLLIERIEGVYALLGTLWLMIPILFFLLFLEKKFVGPFPYMSWKSRWAIILFFLVSLLPFGLFCLALKNAPDGGGMGAAVMASAIVAITLIVDGAVAIYKLMRFGMNNMYLPLLFITVIYGAFRSTEIGEVTSGALWYLLKSII